MYDEVMQLIALAKNDERYFQRIEELKQMQLELAHVKEIAKTLTEAEMHLAKARQNAEELIEDAKAEAASLKEKVLKKEKQVKEFEASVIEREKALKDQAKDIVVKEAELQKAIKEAKDAQAKAEQNYRDSDNIAAGARKLQKQIESKFARIREIMNES